MLPKKFRLKRDKDFKAIFSKRTKTKGAFDPYCGLRFRKNPLPFSRIAVVVGVKVCKSAVDRNKLRRQMLDIVASLFPQIASGFDIVLITQAKAKGADYTVLEKHIKSVLEKGNLLTK